MQKGPDLGSRDTQKELDLGRGEVKMSWTSNGNMTLYICSIFLLHQFIFGNLMVIFIVVF